MKLLTLLLIPFFASATNYYAATTGSDAANGAIGTPFKTWAKLSSVLKPGDSGYIRGGNYSSPTASGASDWLVVWNKVKGTATSHIVISAYPGETPILNLSGFVQSNNTTALRISECEYLDIIGIQIKNLLQGANGNLIAGIDIHASIHMRLERVVVDRIGGAGIRQAIANGVDTRNCNDFTYVNCDASYCADAINTGGGAYGNADGFDCNVGTATYTGCRAFGNSDDGFDCFYNDSLVVYKNCWSFWNGFVPGTWTDPGAQADGMGFKWGSTTSDLRTVHIRTYTNCLAFQNKTFGFTQNTGRCIAWCYNNTSYQNDFKNVRNDGGGFATGWGLNPRAANIFRNNISFSESPAVSDLTGMVQDHNTWNNIPASAASFASLDTTGVTRPRDKDGNLPVSSFLRLSATSNLIDKGIDVGLPFTPPAPDLGAYEVSGVVPPPPVFTNITQSKAFTKNNCTSGSGTSVTYIVPAGKYSASTQAAADQLALNDIAANGQNYANMNGTCIPKTIIKVVIYYSDGTQVIQQ